MVKNRKHDPKDTIYVPRKSSYRFEVLYVDLVGPLGNSQVGPRYILTVEGGCTMFVIAVPIPNKETVTVARSLKDRVILIFGCPEQIHSDQGTEFTPRCDGVNDTAVHQEELHPSIQPQFKYHLEVPQGPWGNSEGNAGPRGPKLTQTGINHRICIKYRSTHLNRGYALLRLVRKRSKDPTGPHLGQPSREIQAHDRFCH